MNAAIAVLSRRLFVLSIAGLSLSPVQGFAAVQADPNAQGWALLLSNRVEDARKIFAADTGSHDPAVAGEAHRGLAEVELFLGEGNERRREIFKAFQADNDTVFFASAINELSYFGRSSEGYQIEEGYSVLQHLTEKTGPFCGALQAVLADRYLADGKLSKATDLIRRMGCIATWKHIGPFENISNSGNSTTYPPEKEIDFSKTYTGKDGAAVAWQNLRTSPASAWIFMGDHAAEPNAIHYLYCTVTSQKRQRARLAFGASGTFAIFLNGTKVLADSIFRNTGVDAYGQEIVLQKGDNELLLKLGHEWVLRDRSGSSYSNFCLRILDDNYQPLTSITTTSTPTSRQAAGEPVPAELRPQPVFDSVVMFMRGRLARNPEDIDAMLRLIHFYIGADMRDESQSFIHACLKRFPNSSCLHWLLSESLLRSKKITEMQAEAHTAWTLSHANCAAWIAELQTISQSGDPQQVLKFIQQSPPNCSGSLAALSAEYAAFGRMDNRNAASDCFRAIEQGYGLREEAQSILASGYIAQGNTKKAEKQWESYRSHYRSSSEACYALMNLAIKKGEPGKAIDILTDGLRFKPVNAYAYYSIANQYYLTRTFPEALAANDSALAIMPTGPDMLNLRGAILDAMGDRARARAAFTEAIRLTRNNFNAWENLRAIDKKPALDSIVSLPAPDAVLANSTAWSGRLGDNGAILSYVKDVFSYPGRICKERTFLLVYLPTEHAIDLWKEYPIAMNGYYQMGYVSRALTLKAGGTQVPADRGLAGIVFKSLQPGDCILLEWTIKNNFTGEMTHQIWGSDRFRQNVPVFDQRLRLITPTNDTIPWKIQGDSIVCTSAVNDDYRITTFSHTPYMAHDREIFGATDWPSNPKVTYSTFAQWAQIVDWYLHLTEHQESSTLEINALADSLFTGATTPLQKVNRIYRYITENIRYSSQSFRQSAWIPQPANEVIATRIGDCKDVASLGRILLQKAGIPADLVLVNTEEHEYIDHAGIGPEFNHCIVTCMLNGRQRFIDFAVKDGSPFMLPPMDQAAHALVIRRGTLAPEKLPIDSAADRSRINSVQAELNQAGTLQSRVTVMHTGVEAWEIRGTYRYLTAEKRATTMQAKIAQEYPDVSIDSLSFAGLDSLSDSLIMNYSFTAKNTVTLSGTTAIFSFHLPDALSPSNYPVEEKRWTPLDFSMSFLSANTQSQRADLTFPEGWKPINLPDPVTLNSPYGSYSLTFSRQGRTISCDRHAVFSLNRQLPVAAYGAVKEFLNAVAKADAVQLVFFTK